jgi:hypothetical protein
MTTSHLPPFFFRAANAVGPVATMDTAALSDHLHSALVTLIVDEVENHGAPPRAGHLAGQLPEHSAMAVSLLARLYPRLHLVAADPGPLHQLAATINPAADLTTGRLDDPGSWRRTGSEGSPRDARAASGSVPSVTRDIALILGTGRTQAAVGRDAGEMVHVSAHGWNVAVDGYGSEDASEAGTPLAWLAAACIGVGEVFRAVFADRLGRRGRTGPQPGGYNLVTGQDRTVELDDLKLTAFTATLVGAGAVGQAAVLALRASGAAGQLSVLDPEVLDLSNCQRYVLSAADEVGIAKVELVARALKGSSVEVLPVRDRWGAGEVGPFARTSLMVALDTAADRIAVAAAMPPSVFNAWTGADDLGWSRHEQVGEAPCLACLYYPDRPRPGEHELVGLALDIHPLRALAYLTDRLPVGVPLLNVLDIAGLPAPPDASDWVNRSLIEDLVASGRISDEEADVFRDRPLGSMYRDGVCGGGLVHLGPAAADGEAMVPLAHQSAMAGVMLATSMLIAQDPVLAARRAVAIEARFDVLRGFPQQLPRPRAKTLGCLCSDPDYLALSQ